MFLQSIRNGENQVVDLSIYYAELRSASRSLTLDLPGLYGDFTDLDHDDTGIENPSGRDDLRLEMQARVMALHDAVKERYTEGSDLSSKLTNIVNNFSQLDISFPSEDDK